MTLSYWCHKYSVALICGRRSSTPSPATKSLTTGFPATISGLSQGQRPPMSTNQPTCTHSVVLNNYTNNFVLQLFIFNVFHRVDQSFLCSPVFTKIVYYVYQEISVHQRLLEHIDWLSVPLIFRAICPQSSIPMPRNAPRHGGRRRQQLWCGFLPQRRPRAPPPSPTWSSLASQFSFAWQVAPLLDFAPLPKLFFL